jgi:hypothetical protein
VKTVAKKKAAPKTKTAQVKKIASWLGCDCNCCGHKCNDK